MAALPEAVLPVLAALAVLAAGGWLVSLAKRDVSIVDSLWSLLVLTPALVVALRLPAPGPRAGWLLALAVLWAARLAVYLTWRNWGEPEDRRYVEIRARNEPHFQWKSLYLIFLLQAALAAVVSLPLVASLAAARAPGWLDWAGIALCAGGLACETLADWQLARFRRAAASAERVLDRGLWRYSRHPNYFGECCVWWGFFLVALSAGAWWTVVSPLLMTVLLLRISGVSLLEKDIALRRPAYRDYVRRTSAFLPWPPRAAD